MRNLIFGLLGIIFVVLKLVGVIGWSWWWVTLPFWGPLAATCVYYVGVFIIMVYVYMLS